MTVKYYNNKWWVFHQEEWREIVEEDWEKVRRLVYTKEWENNLIKLYPDWEPNEHQIYSLPDEMEFEIKLPTNRQIANVFLQLPYHKKFEIMNGCLYSPIDGLNELDKSKVFFRWVKDNGKTEILIEKLDLKVAHLKDSEPKKEPSANYMSIVPQSDDEKFEMYMKLPKEEIAKMLVNCNNALDVVLPIVSYSEVERGEEVNKQPEDCWDELMERLRSESGNTLKQYYSITRKYSQSEIESLKRWIKDQNEAIDKYCDKIEELESKLTAQQEVIENRKFELDGAIKKLKEIDEHREELIAKLMSAEDKIKELSTKEEEPKKD